MIQHHTVAGDTVRIVALPRYTPGAVAAFRAFTASDDIFGLDVETTAIDKKIGAFDPRIKTRAIQFGTADEAWVFDITDTRWRKHWARLLMDLTKRFVSHNAAYDATRVRQIGHHLGDQSIDTLPMACLVHPGREPKDLKHLSDRYLDEGLSQAEHALEALFADLFYGQTATFPKSFVAGESKCRRPKCFAISMVESRCGFCEEHYLARADDGIDEPIRQYGWNNVPLDHPAFLAYAGLDSIYVRRLLPILNAKIKELGMSALGRTEQRVKRMMVDTSYRGHRVDMEWTEFVHRQVSREFRGAANEIERLTGYVAGSPKIKDVWLPDRNVFTKSLDKDHLPGLLMQYGEDPEIGPVLQALSVKSANSNKLTNLSTILTHARLFDGFVHPAINTLQAHTGRMSVTGPAMQTFKGDKGGDARLRGCFIARDGHILIGADYDSQEIRIAAALSGDPALNRIVAEGLNQHVLTAESIFEEFCEALKAHKGDVDKVKKLLPRLYAAAKVLDFAQQYGAGPKKIAANLGISVQEARKMWSAWRETYRGLVDWTDEVGSMTYVVNPFGRVIPSDPGRGYANGNYLIQSSGRDMLGQALCELADNGWAPYFWLPMHDEMILEVPEDMAEKGCAALTEHMTFQFGPIHIPADGEIIGTRWK